MKSLSGKHIIVARVDNKPGVVSRISGLFTRRGYNIESLVTGMTNDPDIYHMTITVIGTKEEVDLLIHQLGRVMEVINIYTAEERECVTRELMFIKLECEASKRAEIMNIADVMNLKIAGVTPKGIIVEVTGDEVKLESSVRAFAHLGVVEIIRSGAITLEL